VFVTELESAADYLRTEEGLDIPFLTLPVESR
jgi:hypothetical protein